MAVKNSKAVAARTTSRPKIPADMARAVLIQAGHRCAVCGDPCPLERAHIIPWHISREHRIDDLVCLCASCHERADLENWGEETLRKYKLNPWILRKNSERDVAGSTQRVEIKLGMTLRHFDATQQRLLVFAIAAFLDLPPDEITVTSIEEGSVKVTVELPSGAAERLVSAFESGDPFLLEILSHSSPVSAAMSGHVLQGQLIRTSSPPPGVDESFDEFLESVTPHLRKMILRYRIPEEDREDIVQQALLALIYQWEAVKDPKGWLLGTLKNHCLMYWRTHRRQLFAVAAFEQLILESEEPSAPTLVGLPREGGVARYLRRVARAIAAAPNPAARADG